MRATNVVAVAFQTTTIAIAFVSSWSSTSAAQTAVPISRTTTYQWIDGFGAAQPGGQHYCLNNPNTLCTCPNHTDGTPEIGQCTNSTECGSGDTCLISVQDFATPLYKTQGASTVMDQLFSTLNGIGLSILRMKVSPTLEWTAGNWTPPASDDAQGWIMQQAVQRGPVKIMASVWSPPGWMKTNGSTIGGFCSDSGSPCVLNADNFTGLVMPRCPATQVCLSGSLLSYFQLAFADYLSYFVDQYKSVFGVNIYAISFSNEPDNHAVYWDTCSWTGETMAPFMAGYLPTGFGNGVRIIAPEASKWTFVDTYTPVATEVTPPLNLAPDSYINAILSSPTARNRLDIVAGHLYNAGNGPGVPPDFGHLFSGNYNALTHIWMTEDPGYACDAANSCANAMQLMMSEVEDIQQQLTGAWVSAWIWFQAYAWGGTSAGLIGNTSVPPAASFFRTKMYWALGNFSRFIRPGFVRIGAPAQPTPKVYVSAFKDYAMDAAGPLVIVISNSNTSSRSVLFQNVSMNATPYITSSTQNLAALPETYLGWAQTIPAMSVVTFVANSPRRTSDILFQDPSTGNTMTWLGAIAGSASYPGNWGLGWALSGTGDFDNDGLGDILFRNTMNLSTQIWHNGGPAGTSFLTFPGTRSVAWQIKGIGDFGFTGFPANGKSDILWWNSQTGAVEVWRDGSASQVTSVGTLGLGWRIQGVGDFDGNGKSDILVRATGQTAIWRDANPGLQTYFALPDDNWTIQGVGEFDNNGKSDIVWRYVGGTIVIWHDGTSNETSPGVLDPSYWHLESIGDFDGNLLSDLLWRNNDGELAIWQNGTPAWTTWPGNPGSTWVVKGNGKFDN